jgi:crotonobetainyl-CoA:carnitine CoA-transferase CaiB-like acyl-CoA transferase
MLMAGNGDSIFKRLMATIGRDDLGADPDLADNAGRVARVARSTPPSAPGRAAHGGEVLAALDAAARAGRAHLHRGRHRRRPALPARGMIADADGRRHHGPCPASCPSSRATPGTTAAMRRTWGRTPMPCCARWAHAAQIASCAKGPGHRERMKHGLAMQSRRIHHFNEVATRDGFQIEPAFMPTDDKVALVDELR